MSKMIVGKHYIAGTSLCMVPLGSRLEMAIPKGNYFLLLEEIDHGNKMDFRVMFDGMEGSLNGTRYCRTGVHSERWKIYLI